MERARPAATTPASGSAEPAAGAPSDLVAQLRTARGTPDERVALAVQRLVDDLGPAEAHVTRFDGGSAAPDRAPGAHVAVPLRRGADVVGALCCRWPHAGSPPVDDARLRPYAAYVEEVLAADERPGTGQELPWVAAAAGFDDLETMTRPMLELLQHITGMESTYLTVIDWAGDEQHVAFSLNTGELVVPEGLDAPWGATLCRRSLEEGRSSTADVPAVWGDSATAQDLGIRSYVSVPLRDPHDDVVGTLCGASSRPVPLDDQQLASMRLFARILADQMARERVRLADAARAAELEERTRRLSDLAARDELTGLVNRAGVFTWLRTVVPGLHPDTEQLALAFVDVDDFKAVNDRWGHAAGDDVLRRLAASLTTVGRVGDLHGRLGGDEFVVAAVLPATDAALGSWALRLRRAATVSTEHGSVTCSVGVTSVTDRAVLPETALQRADEAMYERKARRHETPA